MQLAPCFAVVLASLGAPEPVDESGPPAEPVPATDPVETDEPVRDDASIERAYVGPDTTVETSGAVITIEQPAPAEPPAPPPPSATPEVRAAPERDTRRKRWRQHWSDPSRVFVPTMLLDADYRQRAHEVEGTSGFAMARARLGMRLHPTRWLAAEGNVELVGDHGPFLLDGYASFTPLRWLEVRAGYSPPPLFASFRYEPVATLPMPTRSVVVTEMRVRRDMGVETRFVPRRIPIEAILRLGNGAQGLLGNDNDTPTGYAALDLVLGRAWVAGRNRVVGLRVGAASLLDDAEEHDSIAGRTPLGFAYSRPIVAAGVRNVTEAHVVGYAGPVRLVVEGAWAYESRRADDDGDATTPPVEKDPLQSWGLTGELTWTVRGTWREVGRQPEGPGGRGDRWDGGAIELAARADRLWLGRGTPEVVNGGGTTSALALKWWPTSFLALALYGDATRFDTPPIETPSRSWSWTALVRASFFWGRSTSL